MIKLFIASLSCGAFLLTSCTFTLNSNELITSCIAGFVETSSGKGTLDFFTFTKFSPKIHSLENVSIKTAKTITKQIGVC